VDGLSLGVLIYAAIDSITTNNAQSLPNYMLYPSPHTLNEEETKPCLLSFISQRHCYALHICLYDRLWLDEADSSRRGSLYGVVPDCRLRRHMGKSNRVLVLHRLHASFLQGAALYFFQVGVTNKFLSPEESRKLNKPCFCLNYFDYHGTSEIMFKLLSPWFLMRFVVPLQTFGISSLQSVSPLWPCSATSLTMALSMQRSFQLFVS